MQRRRTDEVPEIIDSIDQPTKKRLCIYLILLQVLVIALLILAWFLVKDNKNYSPTTYYIDSDSGSDSNTGLSETLALKSLSHFNSITLRDGDSVLLKRGSVFRGNLHLPSVPRLRFRDSATITVTAYGSSSGANPVVLGSVDAFSLSNDVTGTTVRFQLQYGFDIGNVVMTLSSDPSTYIFGKKLFEHNLLENYDYFYNPDDDSLSILLPYALSSFALFELAVTSHLIEIVRGRNIDISDIDFKFGAAHGISMSDRSSLVSIHDCSFSYLGGGRLGNTGTRRFGNGVEFWGGASDSIVTRCTFSEIFDTAVTNQGSGRNDVQSNITYSHNTISKPGMAAFELWLQGKSSKMRGILFSDNVCSHVGYGWSLTQTREDSDGLGHFITSFGDKSEQTDIVIQDNTFTDAYNVDGFDSFLLLTFDGEGGVDIDSEPIIVGMSENSIAGVSTQLYYTLDGVPYSRNDIY
eukprot:gnl/Dysnectes_brevis/4869_a6753_748.p1 GENE.gnl/Dysnectes_brevis/4869_a6753_748~~gnl/Dysnectes_brevis/4869_a6753_748.p1  ORF type:complete len:465 (-),score=86.63 gnl/Dysnectes_brevis/4869_a6753_748:80-1474(-)